MDRPKKTRLYRFLETVPGLLTWGTFALAISFSYSKPVWVAVFIILFDLFWLLKALNIGLHLTYGYGKIAIHERYNWLSRCERLISVPRLIENLSLEKREQSRKRLRTDLAETIEKLRSVAVYSTRIDFREILHVVILPTVREPLSVLVTSIDSYVGAEYPHDRVVLVLATEARAGSHAQAAAAEIQKRYAGKFLRLLVTVHPDGIEGETKTKGANLTYAAREARHLVDELGVPYNRVIVSAFDADTVVGKHYFSQLTFTYLTTPRPTRASYQPVPLYNNNVWDSPAINRLAAVTSSFWQMVEASRPDRLVTFSSHSMSLAALVDVDYWPVDVISEDSQIFWRCFLHYNGEYETIPLFTTVSLDAVVLDTYTQSLVGQYKQYRRWAWGIVDWPYVVAGFIRNSAIPLWKRLLYGYRLLEGHYLWATAAVIIAVLGWLPLLLGGSRIENRVLAVNLPKVTGTIMTVSLVFLVFSVIINFILLPKRPRQYHWMRHLGMLLQWLLVPVTSIVFGSLPAIDAQTRLLLGRYMEFWVTPKVRRGGSSEEFSLRQHL